MYDFSGKYAVVTGGGRGIGEAIVRRLVEDHAAGVAILEVGDSETLAKELDPTGSKVLPIACDIADRASVAAAFAQIYAQFGRVDFLLNNAGIVRDKMFHKMEDANWDAVIQVNLTGAYNCTKQVINQMREQSFGRIVFTSSIGIYGAVGQSNYSASKGALYTLTKNLAREQREKGITVNCIIPGPIATEMTREARESSSERASSTRFGQPKDVASLVCYLCTDEAYFINGARIDINGGIS